MNYIPNRSHVLFIRIMDALESSGKTLRTVSEKTNIHRNKLKKQKENNFFVLTQNEWERFVTFAHEECGVDINPRLSEAA